MQRLKSFTVKAGLCFTLATASQTFAVPQDPFGPGFGPLTPDFGPTIPMPDFGGDEYCEPIGDMPDFCIPGFDPLIPNPTAGLETSAQIKVQYRVVDVSSDYGEFLTGPEVYVYALDAETEELVEAQRSGWIILPRAGVYTFHAESPGCSIPAKKQRVTKATRRIQLNAYCG